MMNSTQLGNPPFDPDFPVLDEKVTIEKTLGEGDCAFNAFVLAFSKPEVLAYLDSKQKQNAKEFNDKFQLFLTKASEALDTKNDWDSIKTAITELRKKNKDDLQRKLAPIMREIALNDAENDDKYKESLDIVLSPAFNDFLFKEFAIKVPQDQTPDDFLIRHKFVRDKFLDIVYDEIYKISLEKFEKNDELNKLHTKVENLKNKNDPALEAELKKYHELLKQNLALIKADPKWNAWLKNINTASSTWWKTSGFYQFCNQMRQPTVEAGDIELSRVAQHFEVNLNVIKLEKGKDSIVPAYANKPRFSTSQLNLDSEFLKELNSRQIIEYSRGSSTFCFVSDLSAEEIRKRCSELIELNNNNNNTVLLKWKKWFKEGQIDDEYAKHKDNEEVIRQLKVRNIIDSNGKFLLKKFDEFTKRVKAISEELYPAYQETFFKLIQDPNNFSTSGPVLTLVNNNANHWSNVVHYKPQASTDPEKQSADETTKSNPTVTTQSLFQPTPPKSEVKTVKPVPIPKDIREFFEGKIYQKAKEHIAKDGWSIQKISESYQEVSKFKDPSDENKGKYSFNIYYSKLTTNDDDPLTFEKMLEAFKQIHGEEKLPKITTHDEHAKEEWEKALKLAYPKQKDTIDFEKIILVRTEKPEPVPAVPITTPTPP